MIFLQAVELNSFLLQEDHKRILGIVHIRCERWTKRWTALRILLYLDWSLLFIAPISPVVPAVIAAPLLFNSPVSCWAC